MKNIRIDEIAKVVSGYSGDPDTRDSKQLQLTGRIDDLPLGTVVYVQREEDKLVLIKQSELDRLQDRDDWLEALEQAGVDNWQGWDTAKDIKAEWHRENGDDN